MQKKIIIAILFSFLLILTFCTKKNKITENDSPYLNQNDTVQYVGKETCRLCHADKYNTYMHTGMGLSFDHATKEKSAALYDEHAIVYDTANNFYYKPYFENDTLKITEFRLEGKDTIYKRTENISYIIGSGQHTNSHLVDFNGYVYQAPITFYTQKKKWDMAPGMEGGFNSRFARIIEFECMNCHNGLPSAVKGSVNKYENVATGIDCERCHGPGSLHVASVSAGNLIDTANQIDYTIVNPGKLTVDLQNELCLRCHLQGVNVLNTGSTFFDFKPGDKISDHWNIFLPRFDGKNDKFLMASQADRMELSKCYIQSHKLSCITCHNPHITVKETPAIQFNKACINCHTGNNDFSKTICKESIEVRKLNNDNCSKCHMPQSGAIDIPHVSITDHKIQVPGKEIQKGEGKFTGLQCMTTENPSPVLMAKGYLTYYEAFVKDEELLDSARMWLNKIKTKDDTYFAAEIHLKYLSNDFKDITRAAVEIDNTDDLDAWTLYRIGEGYNALQDAVNAEKYFQYALNKLPYNLDFNLKLGSVKFMNKKYDEAQKIFAFIISENPKYAKAYSNLGFLLSVQNKPAEAEKLLLIAISLDPDYLQARINLCELYIKTRQKQKAKDALQYITRYFPENTQATALAEQLKEI
ncbi:MAG: tetratricopeptide repeat protein [Fimbriimonadaceae bacterium]|nr:tetratricopeptide repeat protein [Chitinophagales bacterium]